MLSPTVPIVSARPAACSPALLPLPGFLPVLPGSLPVLMEEIVLVSPTVSVPSVVPAALLPDLRMSFAWGLVLLRQTDQTRMIQPNPAAGVVNVSD